MGKPSLLIVTLNDYIVYQPTILNLYDVLRNDFDVTIISFEPQYLGKERDYSRKIVYLKPNQLLKELFNKIDFLAGRAARLVKTILPGITYHYLYYNIQLPRVLKRELCRHHPSLVVAVDIPALVVAQEVYGKVHFLSLEIDKNDPFYKHIQYQKISSVFIQSESRFHYLFENRQIPCFLVQNAPVFRASKKQNSQKKDLIWAGTILERFAVYDCIEMIKEFKEFRLVLKGGGEKNTLRHIHTTYNDLLEQNRLEIDRTYLPENEFIEYLSHFRIGICFYSWELIKSSYNYLTAPSGKLFMYMAAGVPVVACRIPGFQFIEDFGAGVLIDNYDPHTIKDAIMRIEADYEKFSEACYEVADFYDFKKNVMPYVEYLKKSVSNEG